MSLPLASSPALDHAANRIASPPRIFSAPRALALWHLASLDAPTVAVVWTLAFAWAGGVRLPLWVPLLVALVTWSVYVSDRLLDGLAGIRTPQQHALRERHFFHWRHRRLLLPLAISAACAAAGLILAFMPPVARAKDAVLAAAALAYFSGVHTGRAGRRRRLGWALSFPGKELLVGVLFTAGCVLPAWHRWHALAAPGALLWTLCIPAATFAALAWLNCTCIARWESTHAAGAAEPESESRSVREPWPRSLATFSACVLLACAGMCLAAAGAALHPHVTALLAAAAASAVLLGLLDCAKAHLSALALRALADFVLLTPLALLVFSRVPR